MLREWTGVTDSDACRCRPAFDGDALTVDADACPGDGRLESAPDCLETVVETLGTEGVDAVVTASDGVERAYCDDAADLLVAAACFATRVATLDERLAERARRDPLGAAAEATGRAGHVATLAEETGLARLATTLSDEPLEPYVGPAISDSRLTEQPPPDAALGERRTLDTGAVVRRYETTTPLNVYHLWPAEHEFDAETTAALAAAVEHISTARGESVPTVHEAVSAVTDGGGTATELAAVLRKHTRGLGVLEDFFADPRVSDVFVTAPVGETRLRVRVGGETMRTNVRLTADGARSLASTFRRTSGRAFSRASPTLDATTTVAGRDVRVAGVTDPLSDGLAFAFRAHDGTRWRLSDLVENGSVPAPVAGLLSVAVERGAACLVAGPRGAGKTTALGALLWELPPAVRTVVIEDTPELPVPDLRADGRDVQPLRTASGDGPSVSATAALRTALRLGEGALVVGEVRGEEASVLYEAMRVGSGDSAVLGTIHGSGGESVRERLVADLGVPASAFAATDLVVTLRPSTAAGGRGVATVEEVVDHGEGVGFETLFGPDDDGTVSTSGRLERGTSHLLGSLADPGESYASVRAAVERRAAAFSDADEFSATPSERHREG